MDNHTATPRGSLLANIQNDILPSIVVFLVALPLCLGIAIASGAPPVAGLITGIVGGLVVGFLAGSPLQVSGPAAGLTVIVAGLYAQYEATPAMVMLIVLLCGLFQLAAGAFKLGQWFRAVSPAVIQGMLAGIGVLIFASQFHIMVDDKPRKGMDFAGLHLEAGLANVLTIPQSVYKIFTPASDPDHLQPANHHWAAAMGLLTIAVIVLWKWKAPKRLKLIPGPLLGVVLATVITMTVGLQIHTLGNQNGVSLIPDNIASGLAFPDLSVWTQASIVSVLVAALGLAMVASAETLLCATAVDQMHQGDRTKYDRELMAQGVGNSICGLLGGLPMTGVIVRSAANVEAGAKSRASAIMHGAWLLLLVALAPFVLKQIPISSLAAVLVFTGYKLVNIQAIKQLWKFGKSEVAIYFATLLTIVCTDLLIGVLTGIVLAAIKLLYTFSHLDIKLTPEPSRRRTALYLNGTATFLRLPKLAAALDEVPHDHELHVHFERLDYIDHACLDLLINWEKQHKSTGGSLVIDWESLTARFNGADLSLANVTGNNGQAGHDEAFSDALPNGSSRGEQAGSSEPVRPYQPSTTGDR